MTCIQYAHLGWMLVKQNAKQVGHADIKDLQRDPMISWQHNHYLPIALTFGIIMPTLVAALWGDALVSWLFYSCYCCNIYIRIRSDIDFLFAFAYRRISYLYRY